jgi:hypothetical protein
MDFPELSRFRGRSGTPGGHAEWSRSFMVKAAPPLYLAWDV